jgi:hypothetical protein
MTVIAPPLDTAGAALLTGIAAVQALVNANATPAIQDAQIQQLNALQVQAVDHFMATYWVLAARILSTFFTPTPISQWDFSMAAMTFDNPAYMFDGLFPGVISVLGPQDPKAAALEAQIAYTQSIVNGGLNPATQPYYKQLLNESQTQLVDYCMNSGAITAANILSTMTGIQSLPFNYVSNYTYYQADIEG